MYKTILNRITADPEVFGGNQSFGVRISIERILSLLAQGESIEPIVGDTPGAGGYSRLHPYAHAVIARERAPREPTRSWRDANGAFQ